MLVLTRRPGESIVIGNGIKLTVVSVGPGRVKIGIEAPPEVRIDREEIHARIQSEQEKATDVLAVVEATAAGTAGHGDQNTMLTSGSSTEILTNRIAGQLPATPPAPPAPGGTPGSAQGSTPTKLHKYRIPRKPR
jgi:carbon storage regulator